MVLLSGQEWSLGQQGKHAREACREEHNYYDKIITGFFSENTIVLAEGEMLLDGMFQSEDGDIIDCIDILKQPALSHPALKNHTIQLKPNSDPKKRRTESETTQWSRKEDIKRNIVISQVWQRKGITCPNGTVPIRTVQKFKKPPKNIYGRKNPTYHQVMQLNDTVSMMLANHSTAVLIAEGYSYTAGKCDIVVWNPNVEADDEYSTSHVSLRNGPLHTYEQIESGWAVNPSVYGDHQTRLFAYWTADSSMKTGCFDHTCPGFVQTNSKIALGAAIHPISKPNGLPYKISIYIYKVILQVKTCGFPPLEDRDKSSGIFSGIDFFGSGKLAKEETTCRDGNKGSK